MELLCPNCQKKLTVPEQYAGQLMRCPLCQGTFTVPALPLAVAPGDAAAAYSSLAPPPPPKQEAYGLAAEPTAASPVSPGPLPPISDEMPSARDSSRAAPSAAGFVSTPPAAPSQGYTTVRTLSANPKTVLWLAPGGLALAFLLSLFPYATIITVKDDVPTVLAGKAWSLGFGKGGAATFIFYDLLTVIAMLLAIASLLITLKVIPDVPALKPIDPFRPLIVGGFAGAAWLLLTLQSVIWLFSLGHCPLSFGGILAWFIHASAVKGAFIEFWLQRRGAGKPPPRISLEW